MMQSRLAHVSLVIALFTATLFFASIDFARATDNTEPHALQEDMDPVNDPALLVNSTAQSQATPTCQQIITNPIYKAAILQTAKLNEPECAAIKDLLDNYDQTAGSEPNRTGITKLNPTFALNLDKMLKAASAGGFKIMVISGWRDSAHNADVGGAANSKHLSGLAADLQYPGTTALKADPNSSFHTCEQPSGGVAAYKFVYDYMNGNNGIKTLMQAFGKPPSAYSGECNHVQDGTGITPTTASQQTPQPGGTQPNGGNPSGTGTAAPNTTPDKVYCVQQSSGLGGLFGSGGSGGYTCSSTMPSANSNNNNLMNQMMQMMMMQQLMGSLSSLTNPNTTGAAAQSSVPATALPPTPLPPASPSTTPPPSGTSTLQSLLDALNGSSPLGTSTPLSTPMNAPNPVDNSGSTTVGQVVTTTTNSISTSSAAVSPDMNMGQSLYGPSVSVSETVTQGPSGATTTDQIDSSVFPTTGPQGTVMPQPQQPSGNFFDAFIYNLRMMFTAVFGGGATNGPLPTTR